MIPSMHASSITSAAIFLALLALHPSNARAQAARSCNSPSTCASQLQAADGRVASEASYQALLHRAEVRRRAGLLRGAIDDASEAITRIAGPQPEPFLLRGDVFMIAGQFSAAIDDYRMVLRFDPRNEQGLMRKALAHRSLGQLKAAVEAYGQVLAIDPMEADAHLGRGLAYAASGHLPAAIADFTRAQRIAPDDPLPLYHRALAWRHAGEPQNALNDLYAALELAPTHAMSLNTRSQIYHEAGFTERALEDANAALRADTQFAAAYHNRASILAALGRVDEALADFERALVLQPSAETLLARAALRARLGQTEAAADDLDAAMLRAPTSPHVYTMKAEALVAAQRYEEADKALVRALLIDPGHLPALRVRIRVAEAAGSPTRVAEARAALHAAVDAAAEAAAKRKVALASAFMAEDFVATFITGEPEEQLVSNAASWCNAELGMETVRGCSQLLALRPDNLAARLLLGNALIKIGWADRALQLADDVARRHDSGADSFIRAGALRLLKRYDQAEAEIARTFAKLPKNPYFLVERALILRQMGKYKQAAEDLADLVKSNPNQYGYQQTLGVLQVAMKDNRRALESLRKAQKLEEDPYNLLFIHLARRQLGETDKAELEKGFLRLGSDKWPYPAFLYLVDRISLQQLMQVAEKKGERCEAYFIAGMHLLPTSSVEGQELLRRAVAECPTDYHESFVARAYLKP